MPRVREYLTALASVAVVVGGFVLAGADDAAGREDPGTVEHVLDYDYQVQETGYWCAAAAARIALSVQGVGVDQEELAEAMDLSPEIGLPRIDRLEDALDVYGGDPSYAVTYATDHPDLRERLTGAVVANVNRGRAVVVNVVRLAGSYFPGGHYATIVGYRSGGAEFLVADPARPGRGHMWLPASEVSNGVKLYRFVS